MILGFADRMTELARGDLSRASRWLLVVVAIAILPAVVLPVWKITLHAPQYPDGLQLTLYAHRIAGDITEINLLNHYIGMEEIQPDTFREFDFLPFFLLRFVGLAFLAAMVARMPLAALGWLDFVIFGGLMMYDFHAWLSRFGQGLAPDAPLTLEPFTPSFLGTTHIGQFAVTSWPQPGGVLMIAVGLLGPVILAYEWRRNRAR